MFYITFSLRPVFNGVLHSCDIQSCLSVSFKDFKGRLEETQRLLHQSPPECVCYWLSWLVKRTDDPLLSYHTIMAYPQGKAL